MTDREIAAELDAIYEQARRIRPLDMQGRRDGFYVDRDDCAERVRQLRTRLLPTSRIPVQPVVPHRMMRG